MTSLARVLSLALPLLVAGTLHCSTSSSSSSEKEPSSAAIGTAGGTVKSSDGSLDLAIPPGALASDVTITLTPIAAPAANSVGTVFEIGPTGTHFNQPVTITFHYGSANLGGHASTDLRVATIVNGKWVALPGTKVDANAQTVSGTTTHLSPYAMTTASGVCFSTGAQGGCAASGGGGGGLGGTSSTSGGGCPPIPTCASASPCGGPYPGSTLASCTDSANGYDATCCYDPDQPVCVSVGAGSGCGGLGGCPPPPTCESSPPQCPSGSTLQSCSNAADGYQATCCFPPGTVPPDVGGSGAADASAGGADAGAGGGGGGCVSVGSCDLGPCCAGCGANNQCNRQ